MNYNILDWIEKVVFVYQPNLTKSLAPVDVSPLKWLKLLRADNGLWLKRLVRHLQKIYSYYLNWNQDCYEIFYYFAREIAKLAEGCVSFEFGIMIFY